MAVEELFQKQRGLLDYFFKHLDLKKAELVFEHFFKCRGSLIFTGVGKSGIIANKLAMTMLSTGTKALYLSSADALHGDLGLVGREDIFICLSKSGETKELLDLVPSVRQKGAFLLSIVSNPLSSLAKVSDLFIDLPLQRELCPFNLAPTTSTALQLIFGDVLAVALMQKKAFSLDEYALNHPSGSIGKKLTLKVSDLMLKENDLPLVSLDLSVADALPILSAKRCGALLVVDEKRRLKGIFTDGDLRRALEQGRQGFLEKRLSDLMTRNFKSILADVLAVKALEKMEEDPQKPISVLPVVDQEQKVLGLVRLHDVLQAGLGA
ncbi:MAG: KpsF/GutQ family sugar-phosphate isomerase [Parachlamydiales bacterium]|jgi:arabinose-5-phosphate isomerase